LVSRGRLISGGQIGNGSPDNGATSGFIDDVRPRAAQRGGELHSSVRVAIVLRSNRIDGEGPGATRTLSGGL
jgi:hypothetical protein